MSGADEAEAERPLFNLHHPLQVGQSWRQAAHAERINEKTAVYSLLRWQIKTDFHGKNRLGVRRFTNFRAHQRMAVSV